MKFRSGIAFLIVLITAVTPLFSQIMVDTFAGGKVRSGVPAQDVLLSFLNGMAWDPRGNLVLCESDTNRIRRIRPDGIIETIAGNGVTGYSGDGGQAVNAALNSPAHPSFDGAGNLYFADLFNYRIRRIDTRGMITTVAGNGILPAPGMALEGPALLRPVDYIIDLAADSGGTLYFVG